MTSGMLVALPKNLGSELSLAVLFDSICQSARSPDFGHQTSVRLETSFAYYADHVRIWAKAVDAEFGTVLWIRIFDRHLLNVENWPKIAQEIATNIFLELP